MAPRRDESEASGERRRARTKSEKRGGDREGGCGGVRLELDLSRTLRLEQPSGRVFLIRIESGLPHQGSGLPCALVLDRAGSRVAWTERVLAPLSPDSERTLRGMGQLSRLLTGSHPSGLIAGRSTLARRRSYRLSCTVDRIPHGHSSPVRPASRAFIVWTTHATHLNQSSSLSPPRLLHRHLLTYLAVASIGLAVACRPPRRSHNQVRAASTAVARPQPPGL
ncbi:hypothetical protein BD626DRAFT_176498 [Schizophyllum amplum]|uniref:Uncharacterized protein n=1 Tax=Schizophyllum amplum TaxID=97359 RepID=A0A550C250_9AGAR|nr:hypothetical protein BD626DRAFT_176498 [Auriculariopsis ampla]